MPAPRARSSIWNGCRCSGKRSPSAHSGSCQREKCAYVIEALPLSEEIRRLLALRHGSLGGRLATLEILDGHEPAGELVVGGAHHNGGPWHDHAREDGRRRVVPAERRHGIREVPRECSGGQEGGRSCGLAYGVESGPLLKHDGGRSMVEGRDSDVGEGENETWRVIRYNGLEGQALETLPETNPVEMIAAT